VTYAYDSATTGATARCFYRKTGAASSTATPLILVRDVNDFAFRRYKVVNGVDYTAANDLETKQIQITLRFRPEPGHDRGDHQCRAVRARRAPQQGRHHLNHALSIFQEPVIRPPSRFSPDRGNC